MPRRPRPPRTRVEIAAFEEAIRALVLANGPPLDCRSVFYLAESQEPGAPGHCEKTERDEKQRVRPALLALRRTGRLSWDAIVDETRPVDHVAGFRSVKDALEQLAGATLDFWEGRDDRPAIFVEKLGLVEVIAPVTRHWGVPLQPLRGDASDSALYRLVRDYLTDKSTVYLFSDLDGKGEGSIYTATARKLRDQFGCRAKVVRVALTPAQVKRYHLSTRPPKKGDTRAYAVELNALLPGVLRGLVDACIRRHVDEDEWQAHLRRVEEFQARLRQLAQAEPEGRL